MKKPPVVGTLSASAPPVDSFTRTWSFTVAVTGAGASTVGASADFVLGFRSFLGFSFFGFAARACGALPSSSLPGPASPPGRLRVVLVAGAATAA